MKSAVTLGLFIILPIIFLWLLQARVSRKLFALFTSLLMALTFFLLSILFVNKDPLVIGTIMFTLALIGSYPTQYFLYPVLSRHIN